MKTILLNFLIMILLDLLSTKRIFEAGNMAQLFLQHFYSISAKKRSPEYKSYFGNTYAQTNI